MGSKGSSAPAPDPRLVEAQIKSMGKQDDAMDWISQNAKDLAPMQKEQMQLGLDSAQTAYQQSQEDRKFALGKRAQLAGLQDGMANDAASFSTEAKSEELAGKAGADVAHGFANAREQSARAQARMGVNPNSGRALATSNQLEMAQAGAIAGARTNARSQALATKFSLADRATNALAGYPAMSLQTAGSGAAIGASGINLANTSLGGLNSGAQTIGSLASQQGSNANGMFNAQAGFKTGQDNAAGDGGAGAIVGLAAAAATAY